MHHTGKPKNVKEFQSAPLTEARGDIWVEAKTSKGKLFQSAPLTEARGDPVGFG